jgi:hypothetical protein
MNPVLSPPFSLRDRFSSSPVTLKDGSQVTKAELATTMHRIAQIIDNPEVEPIFQSCITGQPILNASNSTLSRASDLNILTKTVGSPDTIYTVTEVARKVLPNAVIFDGTKYALINPIKPKDLPNSKRSTEIITPIPSSVISKVPDSVLSKRPLRVSTSNLEDGW